MNKGVFTCVALCFGVLHGTAHAQPNPHTGFPNAADVPVLRDKPEGLIKLDVMVSDARGAPVSGLTGPNFRLLENGREQKILSFQAFTGRGAGTEPPVKVILLIDTFEVPAELARDERRAVAFYLRTNGGRLARPTSVFLLSETGLWAVKHLSGDGNALARELEHNDFTRVHPIAAGQRGLVSEFSSPQSAQRAVTSWRGNIDARMESALGALGQIAAGERRQPGRKLLLWVGPRGGGSDDLKINPSLYDTIYWFSTLLREAHLALYSVPAGETGAPMQLYKDYLAGVSSPHQATIMSLNRNVLAIQSGGRVLDGPGIEDEIENCVRETGPFYRISFDPFRAEQVDEYHDLKVEVDDPSLSPHTNTGYYDQPYYSTDQIPPLKPISLEELTRILELDESDAAKANQLKGVELVRRLSEPRLASLYDIAHGKRTRQQLRILADASSFLDPPADEIVSAPPPGEGEQRRMISKASSYLTAAIPKLPDYFAKRITTRYQETAISIGGGVGYQPLHQTDSSSTTVRYRNGREDSDEKSHGLRRGSPEMITLGVFGPALQNVLESMKKSGQSVWVRWEKVSVGRAAVLRLTIPTDDSIRHVWACCLPDGDGTEAFERYAGYHIELAIDPDSGAILRLSFQFDLKSTSPLSRSDIMIEYGPVLIGGKTYDCPLRSVTIARVRSVGVLSDLGEFFMTFGPYTTMLNDISFDRYHVFRSESRILTGFTPAEK